MKLLALATLFLPALSLASQVILECKNPAQNRVLRVTHQGHHGYEISMRQLNGQLIGSVFVLEGSPDAEQMRYPEVTARPDLRSFEVNHINRAGEKFSIEIKGDQNRYVTLNGAGPGNFSPTRERIYQKLMPESAKSETTLMECMN